MHRESDGSVEPRSDRIWYDEEQTMNELKDWVIEESKARRRRKVTLDDRAACYEAGGG